jgi:hypothetical protein
MEEEKIRLLQIKRLKKEKEKALSNLKEFRMEMGRAVKTKI